MRSFSKPFFLALIALAAAVPPAFGGFLANGGINQSTPNLPPSTGGYVSPADVHACYALIGLGNPLCLVQGDHSFFTNPHYDVVPGTSNGLDQFGSTFTGMATGASLGTNVMPLTLSGPVQVEIFNRPSNNMTGTFDTEMLQLDLSGGPGIMIRESPTLASTGMTKITDNGNGTFHIDSFFDIFTELSLDGGATWTPSTAPTHVDLVTPEPATFGILGLGSLALVIFRRRR